MDIRYVHCHLSYILLFYNKLSGLNELKPYIDKNVDK